MNSLSASATAILKYAKQHSEDDGFVDLQDYAGLPDEVVRNACNELEKRGLISDILYSDDGVESFSMWQFSTSTPEYQTPPSAISI